MVLTKFGLFTRKLRLERGEVLKDMAFNLSVTPAYLSFVERGERNVPKAWLDVLKRKYKLSHDEFDELTNAYYNSRYYDRVDLSKLNMKEKVFFTKLVDNILKLDVSKREDLIDYVSDYFV